MRAVRVLPDVAGLDKTFDYSVPAGLADHVRLGSRVRVVLHGRRVGGWVVADDVTPPPGVSLLPLAKVSGWGPSADVLQLSEWAAWRWAGRRSALLTAASPPRAVGRLPEPAVAAPDPVADQWWTDLFQPGTTVARLAPAADRMPVVLAAVARGPALILVPSIHEAAVLARRLHGSGVPTALMPDGWPDARAGGRTVIGARGAAWAPAEHVASMVILDAHDEAYKEERSPAWHARDVLGERARQAGIPCLAVSPCPDLATMAWADHFAAAGSERDGWPKADAVDLRQEDPTHGLLTDRLTDLVRGRGRVVCILNRKGRARLLACARCQDIAVCAACDAAVTLVEEGLRCPRCGTERPVLCTGCGAQRMKVLRPGVSRLREEIEALAGEPVGEVTATADLGAGARIVIGTEAALHRVGRSETVVFLDFDQELLAPRYRAAEEAMALLARAGRLVGGRRGGGRVVVQTRLPDHEVVLALIHGDPGGVVDPERARREALRLPPSAALAVVSGAGAASFVESLEGVEAAAADGDTWLVRAPHHEALCDALARGRRPPGRLRIEVDPLRL